MNAVIDWAFAHSRTVMIALAFVLVVGTVSYVSISKEAAPEIPIPTIYVSVVHSGISPEDAERLLVRPLETELQSLSGLDELNALAAEGYANLTLQFDPGFDPEDALDDVREAVDRANPELPADAEEPVVREVNTALFPILTIVLSGPAPERTLLKLANQVQDRLEALPGVLEVDIGGDREEVVEVIVDPVALEGYDISFDVLLNQIQRNNRLVAAGAIDTGAGRMAIKVPGVIENIEDVTSIPVKTASGAVVTVEDIALVRRTFEDPTGFARIGGQPALSLEVKKRVDANIIATVEQVRAVVERVQDAWPASVNVSFLQDQSRQTRTVLADLQNNVLSAILLVIIVMILTLGIRGALLVGIAIPGSFLAGIALFYFVGYTMNIVVLFSLILVVGMLVDGAIVTTELADRYLTDGLAPKEAYSAAAKRMAWPITTATATTLSVFIPLLFWGGVVGEFMKFLPLTVIVTLTASLLMALVFIPVLGGVIGRRQGRAAENSSRAPGSKGMRLEDVRGWTRTYLSGLSVCVRWPTTTLLAAIVCLVVSYSAYGVFGRGLEFFPEIEPEFVQLQVNSRDNLSIWEKDRLVRLVEREITGVSGVEHVYSRTIGGRTSAELSQETIGVIQLDLRDWDRRRRAAEILAQLRSRVSDIAGVQIQAQEQQQGPSQGKPIQLRLSSSDADQLRRATEQVRGLMASIGDLEDVSDTRPLPGVEWRLLVEREKAARYGADIALLGQAVQLLTEGLRLADFRPDEADDEVEIRVRYPSDERNLERLEHLRVPTAAGQIPISNFVRFEPAEQTGTITRVNGRRTITVEADVSEGSLASEKIEQLQQVLASTELPEGVEATMTGQAEDQAEAMSFLFRAFVAALFLMAIILVTQFNSIYQAILILSAIVFSTAGVLLGLLITGRPFGIVMSGIGMIALAGIVVNNNIVLIDTFNEMRREGFPTTEASLRAGVQRLRPVLLTSLTTVLALMPMVFGMNIDLVNRDVQFGAPSTQYWTELSSSIAGGLTFATLLTLILTPCLLVLGEKVSEGLRTSRWRRRSSGTRYLTQTE